jgi:ubiquinone biosynthesis protein
MNEQIGWRALVSQLKQEAPRYAHFLPELPRLLHEALAARTAVASGAGGPSQALMEALLVEQRRTNRLLQALGWAAMGFVLGALAVQVLSRFGPPL